jgi:hypothetical protein
VAGSEKTPNEPRKRNNTGSGPMRSA